jgi:Universal stress protein family
MPDKIVVGIRGDDPESRDALALGVALARVTGAELILAATWAAMFGPGVASYDRAVREVLHHDLDVLASELPADVVATEQVRASTSTVRALHELAEHECASALVIGPRRAGAPRCRRARGRLERARMSAGSVVADALLVPLGVGVPTP